MPDMDIYLSIYLYFNLDASFDKPIVQLQAQWHESQPSEAADAISNITFFQSTDDPKSIAVHTFRVCTELDQKTKTNFNVYCS